MREILSACALAAMLASPALAQDACGLDAIGGGIAVRAVDGRSFVLQDGREILLAGIEVPSGGETHLNQLLGGQNVTLRSAEAGPDRYRRLPAFATVSASKTLIQQALLTAGKARLGIRIGAPACAAALHAAERTARDSGVGLWADPVYSVRRADQGRALLGEVGRFAVVAGEVVSVRESGGTIYVNFGKRWSEALTVTILKRDERAFAEAGVTRAAMERSRLTVRGFIEERNGPRIAASRPEQIEIARN